MAEHEHGGHRQRIIQKLDSGTLCDHEILEVLLFNAIPRRNTNDLAHRLLSAFGDLRSVFSATVEQLSSVDGIGINTAAYLNCIGKIFEKCYDLADARVPRKYKKDAFLQFVEREYEKERDEVLDFYFLNEDGLIIMYKRFRSNNAYSVRVDPRDFTQLLIAHRPSGVVIVHNHPKGKPEPSKQDDDFTAQCVMDCALHNVLCCEHIIHSPCGLYSYYYSGRMNDFNSRFSVKKLLQNVRLEENQ